MNTENINPDNNPDNTQWKQEQEEGHTPGYDTTEGGLESQGPDNDKSTNVLNPDGSLGDLPDQDGEGSGALDGVVGLGT